MNGLPMPLYERFAKGTEWVLTVPVQSHAVGSRVRVEEEPLPLVYAFGDDPLVCVVTDVETEESFVVDIAVLG